MRPPSFPYLRLPSMMPLWPLTQVGIAVAAIVHNGRLPLHQSPPQVINAATGVHIRSGGHNASVQNGPHLRQHIQVAVWRAAEKDSDPSHHTLGPHTVFCVNGHPGRLGSAAQHAEKGQKPGAAASGSRECRRETRPQWLRGPAPAGSNCCLTAV